MNQLVTMSAAASFTVSDVERVANAIAKGGLFGSKDPNAVLTLCLLAQAEGQHPAVVFRDYHIIQGKPAKKAEAMLRDFINAGGKVEWHKLDDTGADATFTHPSGSARIEWTLERAKKAGISTPMWSKYPRQMLRSRVISEGVRTVYPGATSGLYVPEEVSGFEPSADEPAHDAEAGAIIEGAAAEKVPGITKIKERLRLMRTAGEAPDITLEGFRKLKRDNREDLKSIRDANHGWWTGDGEDFEGYGPWMDRRLAELVAAEESDGSYKALIDSMKTCDTKTGLENWFGANEAVIDTLTDAERRSFDLAYELHESALLEPVAADNSWRSNPLAAG